ncbi:MAG: cell division protein ZapA [Rhizobiales bacterium]|nr:cell division protein ZapA [Hyphomicrobiales bacterium]
MPQVTVTINSRQYRMACEDGQEDHLLALCADLNRRIAELSGKFGEIGDARLILMAALSVADELADTGERIRRLEQELATLRNARSATADRTQAGQAAIVDAFNTAADRIERLSKRLNQSLGNGVAIG